MLRKLVSLAFLLVGVAPSWADADTLQQRGEARFVWLGIPVCTARLFTPGGVPLNWEEDLNLELTYQRSLTSLGLIDNTQSEMRRLGYASPSKAALQACLSNVVRGDRIAAITNGPDQVRFDVNVSEKGRLNHPDVRRGVVSILLSENSRSPDFSRSLRND